MCACTHSFTCARCAGTPFDPRYFEDEPAELSEPDFQELVFEPRAPILMLGEEG